MLNCCGLCTPSVQLSNEDMQNIELHLGNIKLSHKAITFAGLIHLGQGKAQFIHYMVDPAFSQYHRANLNSEQAELAANTPGPLKMGPTHLKRKVEMLLSQVVSFRIA